MSNGIRRLVVAALVATLLGGVLVVWRHRIVFFALSLAGPPPLLDAQEEGPAVRWHDDYFTIEALDERTFAIGEPRYAQQVFAYLILGRDRALLFDAGPGLRDIRPVVAALTPLPVTFVPSHFHFDHIGNEITFDDVAVIDLPELRARADAAGRLPLTWNEHLGSVEGFAIPTLEVDRWLQHGERIELGERTLEVIHTPGHTEDSVSLRDLASGDLFTGDFLYAGPLFAFMPNSRMGDYLLAAERVSAVAGTEARIFGAHRGGPPGLPRLSADDVDALHASLREIRAGERSGAGFYPVTYEVNERIQIVADPSWLQDWSSPFR